MNTHSFVFKIITIFLIFVIIPFTLIVTVYIKDSKKVTNSIIEENLTKLVEQKKIILESKIREIEKHTIELGYWLKEFYKRKNINLKDFEKAYFYNESGALTDYKNSDNMSIFVNQNVILTEDVKEQIIKMENMEEVLTRLVYENKNIVCAYIISKDEVLKVYPYLPINTFKGNHDFKKDIYYKDVILNSTVNTNKVYWTKPYNDWANRGWITTCYYPVFISGKLEGIVYVDVTMDFFSKAIADFRISKSGISFLIDSQGNIIYHPSYMRDSNEKGEVLNDNIKTLHGSIDFRNIIKNMGKGKKGLERYMDENDSHHVVTYAPIKNLNWSIGLDIKESEYRISMSKYFASFPIIVTIMIIITIIGVLFLKRLSNPIVKLSKNAEKLASGDLSYKLNLNTDDEIGSLANSINSMSYNMEKYIKNLKKKKLQLETVLDSISGNLYIIDTEYNILIANKQGRQLKRNKDMNVVGSKCYRVFEESDNPCKNCPVKETKNTFNESYSKVIFGNNIFNIWSFPVKNEYGKIEEIVIYCVDVTEKTILQREFYQKEKLAGLGILASGITHELKNPISIIKGNSYLIKHILKDLKINSQFKKDISESIKDIDNSIKYSEQIINNLLDFSRVSYDNNETIYIEPLIDQILILFRKNMVQKNIKIKKVFDSKSLNVHINVDSIKIILFNVISNAIDSIDKNGEVIIKGKEIIQGKTKIEVIDNGCGIPENFKKRVFEPFFTTKPKGLGTGIGLWIVKNEIKKYNGSINIENRLTRGTKVSIILK